MKTFDEKNGVIEQMEIPIDGMEVHYSKSNPRSNATSDLGRMKQLEIGQEVTFPITKMFTIRANTSNINTQRGFKSLRSSTNKEAKTITVHRIA